MSKAFYSDFTTHCLRSYARHPLSISPSAVETNNWNACDTALKSFSENERDMLISIYREGDTIPDNVYKVSIENKVKQNVLWSLIDKLEARIAKIRGIL